MKSILCCVFLYLGFSSIASARFVLAPPNFDLNDGGGHAVFVDFLTAEYCVTYDITSKETRVQSTLVFRSDEIGFPIFDLIDDPFFVELDGEKVTQRLIETPHDSKSNEYSQIRVVEKAVTPGTHRLVIEHTLKKFPANFQVDRVESGFFMSDFEPRGLLERYLPTNFEYDQIAMKLNISILGATAEEVIFTNGAVSHQAGNNWSITFPSYFNCSALYFHVRPKDELAILQYNFSSKDGRNILVTIYENKGPWNNLAEFKSTADQNLSLFENLFGPFPHSSLTIFINGLIGTGMEYAGALSTDLDFLPHELAHSYFGRGVMSASGNSGWIDEAMASLAGGPQSSNPADFKAVNMANHSPYFRQNDALGYYYGQNFLHYLGELFVQKDPSLSLNGFLKKWISTRQREVVTTEILRSDMEQYSGLDLAKLFETYLYQSR